MLTILLQALGALTATYTAARLVRFLHFLARPSTFHRYARPGAWALITGSSDGIGLAFARECAARGLNVVLHGRNEEKLNGVKGRLGEAFPGVEVRVLVADAASAHGMKRSIEGMVEEVGRLPGPLTVLINNW